APELSATVSHVRICTIVLLPCCTAGALNALCHARRTLQNFLQPPPLQLRERPRGNDLHRIAHARFTGFVVRVVFLSVAHNPLIERMLHRARHLHHDGLLHLSGSDDPGQFLPHAASVCGLLSGPCCRFVCHYAFLNSLSRSKVFTRAKSRLASRNFRSPSDCPVESWKRRRKICSANSPCCVSS